MEEKQGCFIDIGSQSMTYNLENLPKFDLRTNVKTININVHWNSQSRTRCLMLTTVIEEVRVLLAMKLGQCRGHSGVEVGHLHWSNKAGELFIAPRAWWPCFAQMCRCAVAVAAVGGSGPWLQGGGARTPCPAAPCTTVECCSIRGCTVPTVEGG